jgi:hypothetical protein
MVPEATPNTCFASVHFALDTNIQAKHKNGLKELIIKNGGVVHDFITSKVW